VKNANTTCLIGKALLEDLVERLGPRVRLANDANCFAVAEAVAGAARDGRVVFGIILGTGVGGALVIDGHARFGLHGIAGEWGHSPIEDRDPEGPPAARCYCGQLGCVETRLSGPAFEADYRRLGGEARDAAAILARVEGGDPAAHRALERYLGFFGEGVARVIHVLDPDVIVLGGGMANNPYLYDRGREAIARVLFSDRLLTPLRQNALGDSAGVFGAAWLWGRTPLQVGGARKGG
jgi:fructokinase